MCKHKSTARVSTFRTNLKFDIWYDALFLVLTASICLGTLSSNFFKYSSGIVFRDSWRCFQKLFFGPEIWTLWRWSLTASVMLRLRLRLWGGQSMPDTAPILLSRYAFTAYRVFWLIVMLNNEAFAIRMFFSRSFCALDGSLMWFWVNAAPNHDWDSTMFYRCSSHHSSSFSWPTVKPTCCVTNQ